MKFPIEQFEQHIHEAILKRGLSYFKSGAVRTFEKISKGCYEAIVEGSVDYTVQIKVNKGVVTDFSCDCPYDSGPVCKHVAAVLFHMQQDELDLHPAEEGSRKRSGKNKASIQPRKKSKTVADQVKHILSTVSHQELMAFILENTKTSRILREVFLASFAHHNAEETQQFYNEQVKSILRQSAGRHGFIDRVEVSHVHKLISGLIKQAYKQYAQKNYKSVIFQCCAIAEEMTDALQFTDDSNGDVGDCIFQSLDLLQEIASNKSLPEEARIQLLQYCIQAHETGRFAGWDWHFQLIHVAMDLIRADEEADIVIALLKRKQSGTFESEQSKTLLLEVLSRFRSEKEVDAFAEHNLSNPDIRESVIKNALSKRDFAKAIRIAKEGLVYDKKDRPGLLMRWYDWLLVIAGRQKDNQKIVEYARILFVQSVYEKAGYYKMLKANVPPNEWANFVSQLVNDVRKHSRFGDSALIATIFIWEQQWENLLNFVKEADLSLEGVYAYEQYLVKDYPNELAGLYKERIIERLDNSNDRKGYQQACRYLRRMIKLGAGNIVEAMIQDLRRKYPKRKALLEELNRM
ncbi:MAG: SWIM zinc finger family protein [Bacteroidota bacterium]|nr:SWIM zinc finger family protein [Bacteroidota bacterium]